MVSWLPGCSATDCCNTQTKVIALANQKGKYPKEPMRDQNKFKQRSMKCWKYELPSCDWFRFSSHWFDDGANFSDQSETESKEHRKKRA